MTMAINFALALFFRFPFSSFRSLFISARRKNPEKGKRLGGDGGGKRKLLGWIKLSKAVEREIEKDLSNHLN
jgi:hypothetical protein